MGGASSHALTDSREKPVHTALVDGALGNGISVGPLYNAVPMILVNLH